MLRDNKKLSAISAAICIGFAALTAPAAAQEAWSPVYINQVSTSFVQAANSMVYPDTSVIDSIPTLPSNSTGNLSFVLQQGDFNTASITQSGQRNVGLIYQIGYNNTAAITQTGNGHRGLIMQQGSNNVAILTQR